MAVFKILIQLHWLANSKKHFKTWPKNFVRQVTVPSALTYQQGEAACLLTNLSFTTAANKTDNSINHHENVPLQRRGCGLKAGFKYTITMPLHNKK